MSSHGAAPPRLVQRELSQLDREPFDLQCGQPQPYVHCQPHMHGKTSRAVSDRGTPMPASRSLFNLLPRRSPIRRIASELYGRLVAHARARTFYADLGVPDTPEGRLEVLMLCVVLMLRRLKKEGESATPIARALSETFVTDMDDCLREMGVGDMMVATKVKKAAAALFDRSRDYGAALSGGDDAALARLVALHVLAIGQDDDEPDVAGSIAAHARAFEEALLASPLAAIVEGNAVLPEPRA